MPQASAAESLYLVDAHSLIFQVFHGIKGMTSPNGMPTNAVFGFLRDMLFLRALHPTYLICAFDRSEPTFRNELYAEYKAHRSPVPEDLSLQIPLIREAMEGLGIPVLSHPRYEADDILATLARRVVNQGHRAVVVTADKDLCQLVCDNISVYDLGKDVRLGAAEVFTKLGVRPEQVPDFLGLAGDAVDNIPGIRGVGPKTATALLAAFPNLEAMYERIEEVDGLPIRGAKSLKAKLIAGRDDAFLSRRLATVAYDAPVTATFEDLAFKGPDYPAAAKLFEELGFDGMKKRAEQRR